MDIKTTFVQWKEQCMKKVDFSKKGSVDEDILDIVNFINASENYFTTSSCSGRIILIDGVTNCSEVQKQNCSWLFVTHQKCQNTDVVAGLEKSRGDAVFKFEPFVLHVQCKQLEDAQLLHSLAINSGFRNSGITVGKKGKIIMAVRSTHCLEVPLSREGQSLVNADYIDFLVEIANQKMEENLRRIQRFYDCLQSTMHPGEAHRDFPGVTKEKLVYRRRRKRTQDIPRADSCHQSNEVDTLNNGDDGFDFGLELFT